LILERERQLLVGGERNASRSDTDGLRAAENQIGAFWFRGVLMSSVKRSLRLVALLVVALNYSPTPTFAGQFDGSWSVSIVADGADCPTQTIPVQVADGIVSFSAFGATASGAVGKSGSVNLQISFNEQVIRARGKLGGGKAAGSWHSSPAGCGGRWTAQRTVELAKR
jgi:hypothetical protein